MILLWQNSKYHVRIVGFEAAIVERWEREFCSLLILLIMACAKQIAILVVVKIVQVRILVEVNALHETVLIITEQIGNVIVVIDIDIIHFKRGLLLKASRLNQVVFQSKSLWRSNTWLCLLLWESCQRFVVWYVWFGISWLLLGKKRVIEVLHVATTIDLLLAVHWFLPRFLHTMFGLFNRGISRW